MVAYVLIGLFALLIFLSISDVVIAFADWSPKKALKPGGGNHIHKETDRSVSYVALSLPAGSAVAIGNEPRPSKSFYR